MSIGLIIVLSIIGILLTYLGISVFRFKNQMANSATEKDSENVQILNDNTFYHRISGSVALVDFWASWCQPCKIQGPIVSEIADEFHEKAKICKLDIDKNKKIAHKLGIKNIPTIIIFNNGKEVERLVGLKAKNMLRKTINKHL
jgi:thioredoxin